jgi:hypothetical protein
MNLAQRFRFLFGVRKPLARRCRPQLEGLTERITPAVTASVIAGVLTVKPETPTDANDDVLSVTPVAGFAGRFTLAAVNGTFVNGTPFGTFDAVGVTSMKVDLGEGNDSLEAKNLVLTGGISFRGGNGSNTFTLEDSLIGGGVSVTNLTNTSGSDNTTILNSTINGSVAVNGGLGATSGFFNNAFILGNLNYTTASSTMNPGDDSIDGSGLIVGGNITVALANGENEFKANTIPVETGGGFTYTGGAGGDRVDFTAGASIGTFATINLGEGENFMTGQAYDVFVGTKLTVTAGAGNDFFALTSATLSRVKGAVVFNLGNGVNSVVTSRLQVGSLGVNAGTGNDTGTFNNLTVAGAASLNFGAGTNTIKLSSTGSSTAPSVIGGALTLTTGAGADLLQIGVNNAFRVGGAAKFTVGTTAAGNGNDSVQINNALFASSLSIVGGAGNDGLHIGDAASVGIAGKLTVNANAGNDQLFLGTFNDPSKVVRLLVVPVLIGGAGAGDIVKMFPQANGGNVQGPPGVTVFPTGPALLAAGWEGIV